MVQKFPDILALLQYAEDQRLYRDLVQQLRKDFVLANTNVDFKDGISPMELKTLVHEKVYHLMMEKFTGYLNLLYIIDVPERAMKAIKADDVVDISEQVSFEVLKRECQKVWFRKNYGSWPYLF